MDNPLISTKLIDIYHLIIDGRIGVSDLNVILDDEFLSEVKLNTNSFMPLMGAVGKHSFEILEFLISHKIYSTLNKKEVTILLQKTADHDNDIGFDYLTKKLTLPRDLEINKLFERVCSVGCLNMITYFLDSKNNWNIDINQTSGLLSACYQERKNIVKYLVENGADFSLNNYRAVTMAFNNDTLDIFNYFLFETDIDLCQMKECVSKLDVDDDEKIMYENFIDTVGKAILNKKLTQSLTDKYHSNFIKI